MSSKGLKSHLRHKENQKQLKQVFPISATFGFSNYRRMVLPDWKSSFRCPGLTQLLCLLLNGTLKLPALSGLWFTEQQQSFWTGSLYFPHLCDLCASSRTHGTQEDTAELGDQKSNPYQKIFLPSKTFPFQKRTNV